MDYIKNLPAWVKVTGKVALSVLIVYLIFKNKVDAYIIEKSGALNGEPDPDTVLSLGSRGAEVAELQRRLKSDGAADILGATGPAGDGVDGVFGPKTESALLEVKGVSEITLAAYPNIRKTRGGMTGTESQLTAMA